MISDICSNVRSFVFDIQDKKKIAAISIVPIAGFAWGLFWQIDQKFRLIMHPTDREQTFKEISRKNQIKKICSLGGLVQSIAYVAYHVFHGSLAAALKKSPFLSMTLMFSGLFYITAMINESNIKSSKDISFGTTIY